MVPRTGCQEGELGCPLGLKSGPQPGRGRRPPPCSLCSGPGPVPSPSPLLTPKSLEAHSDPVTSVLRAQRRGRGCGHPAISPASSGLGCGPVHPRERALAPVGEQALGVLLSPPHSSVSHLPWGSSMGAAGRECVLLGGVHTQHSHPSPRGRKCHLTHSRGPGGGLTSWKAVRQLSLPRKPGGWREWG